MGVIKSLKRKHLLLIAIALILVCIFSSYTTSRSSKAQVAQKNAVALKQKKVKNKKVSKSYKYTLSVKDKIKEAPLLVQDYNLNGKNNDEYYNHLNYGLVWDSSYYGLNVISGHDYSFFSNLKSLEFDDVITIKNNKDKKNKHYKVTKVFKVDENDADSIYNDKFIDNENALVLYTCSAKGIFDLASPTNRVVVYATLQDEATNI